MSNHLSKIKKNQEKIKVGEDNEIELNISLAKKVKEENKQVII